MPVAVNDLVMLRAYVRGVLGKAKHHAQNVDEIVLALAGGVISRQGSLPLEVRKAPSGGLGLTLTFTSARRKRYCLSYNHVAKEIELREKSYKDPVLHSFDNATPIADVASAFAGL
jgi:hypothetical protein